MKLVAPLTVVRTVPPRLIVYLATPTASVEAVQETVTEFQALDVAVTPVGTVGAVVSAAVPSVVLETAVVLAVSLPAASTAVIW
jgi:hypothetical protein